MIAISLSGGNNGTGLTDHVFANSIQLPKTCSQASKPVSIGRCLDASWCSSETGSSVGGFLLELSIPTSSGIPVPSLGIVVGWKTEKGSANDSNHAEEIVREPGSFLQDLLYGRG